MFLSLMRSDNEVLSTQLLFSEITAPAKAHFSLIIIKIEAKLEFPNGIGSNCASKSVALNTASANENRFACKSAFEYPLTTIHHNLFPLNLLVRTLWLLFEVL